ncbi:hypothetical protein MXB_268 [Myxobolus squamalis]|nr:hypothetical protein MXB_268 [Myxobolus squamalis]
MADDDELLVIFMDRNINIDAKSERNLKKLLFPQFKSQRSIEIFRNEYSYIVEGVMDILRIVIDIFYKKLNIFLCIDGQTGKYFNKNTNNYKNVKNEFDNFR